MWVTPLERVKQVPQVEPQATATVPALTVAENDRLELPYALTRHDV